MSSPVKAPSTAGPGKASGHSPPRTAGPGEEARTAPLPQEQLPTAQPLSAPRRHAPVPLELSEVCAPISHFCPHSASAVESCSPCPLPPQASRACHTPTFTAIKKGDPEPGLVGVPSSHSSRRNTSSSSRTLSKRPIASSSSSMAAGAAEGKQEAGSTQQ